VRVRRVPMVKERLEEQGAVPVDNDEEDNGHTATKIKGLTLER
jgi:hypothetical protein